MHEYWLKKAESDLNLAKKGAIGDDDTFDSAIYHTQQCAEKALKGYLVCKKEKLLRTHDLTDLLERCSRYDSAFEYLSDDVFVLSPYSMEFRYTDYTTSGPSLDSLEEAIRFADKILRFVRERIDL